jgi:hypothetical protein
VGTSSSAFLPADSPLIGREVVSVRIYLNVESFAGSDAGNFLTDISFPISPFLGNENSLTLSGSELGWSGSGMFQFFEETERLNGIFVSTRYVGETPGENFDGRLLEAARIELDLPPRSAVPDTGGISLVVLAGAALAGFGGFTRRGAAGICSD